MQTKKKKKKECIIDFQMAKMQQPELLADYGMVGLQSFLS